MLVSAKKILSFCPIFTGHVLAFIEGSTSTNASFRTNSQNCHRMDHIVCFWANGYYQRNNPIHHCFISGRCIFLKEEYHSLLVSARKTSSSFTRKMTALLQTIHTFCLIMGMGLLSRKKLYKTLHYSRLTPTSKNGPSPNNEKKSRCVRLKKKKALSLISPYFKQQICFSSYWVPEWFQNIIGNIQLSSLKSYAICPFGQTVFMSNDFMLIDRIRKPIPKIYSPKRFSQNLIPTID